MHIHELSNFSPITTNDRHKKPDSLILKLYQRSIRKYQIQIISFLDSLLETSGSSGILLKIRIFIEQNLVFKVIDRLIECVL